MAEMRGAGDDSAEQRRRDPQQNRREYPDRLPAGNDQSSKPADDEPDQRPPQQHRRKAESRPADNRQDHDRGDQEKQEHHIVWLPDTLPAYTHARRENAAAERAEQPADRVLCLVTGGERP